jgi:hypothetical protein
MTSDTTGDQADIVNKEDEDNLRLSQFIDGREWAKVI